VYLKSDLIRGVAFDGSGFIRWGTTVLSLEIQLSEGMGWDHSPRHICLPFLTKEGPSWSYGSWIYIYLFNHCLSPLKLWVWIPLMERCTKYIMWFCQWLATSLVFSGYSIFLNQYNWNIVESCILKYHCANSLDPIIRGDCYTSDQLNTATFLCIPNIICHGPFLCPVTYGERWLFVLLILVKLLTITI
jgi:hypothetical protein